MAKRRIRAAELAGLAALGAFGYNFFGPGRDKKAGERRADVEYRGTDRPPAESVAAPAASLAPPIQRPVASFDDGDIGRFANVGSNFNETGQPYYPVGSLAAGAGSPAGGGATGAGAAAGATRSLAPAARNAPVSTAQFLNTDADFMPSRMAQAPVIGPRSEGVGGPTAADIAMYRRQQQQEAMRGRGLGRVDVDPRSRPVVPRSRPMTREELINQIPTGANTTVADGRQVTGGDISRNLANIAAAMGPTRLAGFGNAAIEGATARGALQRAAALRAERAEAGRRGQTPTNFSSSSSSTTTRANRATKKTKKFDEDTENVEFKRGGKAMSKTKNMASGGMSSASKRGDGIATKGKTKCKMY